MQGIQPQARAGVAATGAEVLASRSGIASGASVMTPEVEAGVRGGPLVGPVELSLRLGWDRKGPWALAIPPVYAVVGVGFRWPLARAP
jgi:hypothetical protein